jgi:cation diffusion facilitator family transporter
LADFEEQDLESMQEKRPHPLPIAKPAEEQKTEAATIQQVAFYAVLVNIALAVIKGVLAHVTGSLAITAGAIDSATDSVASLAVWSGLKLSERKSPNFPLGLYKIENVISVVVAIFIFFAGYEIAREILKPGKAGPDISLIALCLLAVGTVATFLFGVYAMSMGKKTESPTLIAEGRHRRVDVLSSLLVLGSALADFFQVRTLILGVPVDKIVAGVVLIFIGHAGWELLKDGMRVLLDASVDRDTLERVKQIIREEPGVIAVKSVVGRNAGRFRFIQIDVSMRTHDLQKAHTISERIEARIRKEISHVERVNIHYEPHRATHRRIAVPLAESKQEMSENFGRAPYFAIFLVRVIDGAVEGQDILANPHQHVDKARGILVGKWLVNQKIDEILVADDITEKGPGYVFSDAAIRIRVVPAMSLKEAMQMLRER